MQNTQPQNPLPFQLKTLFALFCLLVVWQAISILLFPKGSLIASDLTLDNILKAVSAERTLRNLNALNSDNRLSFAAQYKANDMMNRRYFSHTDPEGNYIWGKIAEAGYTAYLQLGENLAIEFYNTESLTSAWMNSPTHRANILNEGFKDQGMGLAFGKPDEGQYYSSIANTFGALVIAKKEQTPAPPPPSVEPKKIEPPPAVQKAPAQSPASAPPVPSPTPAHTEAIDITAPKTAATQKPQSEPLRDTLPSLDVKPLAQNFALPQKASLPATSEIAKPIDTAVMPDLTPPQGFSSYEINRYLMMGLSVILILMLASDLKKILEQKIHTYDKKINNLVLLILSLIVIGLMYWL